MTQLCDLCVRFSQWNMSTELFVLARRRGFGGVGRLFSGLYAGNPTSWAIFVGLVGVTGVVYFVKSRMDE